MPFEELVKIFGTPEQRYWATKVQSANTYFVWNPQEKPAKPFFIKMQIASGNVVRNHSENSQMAVQINDVVEKSINESQESGDSFFSVFPERFGATYSKGDFSYSYSIRSVHPLGVPESTDIQLYPLHAFLSKSMSKERTKISKKMGMNANTWMMDEYLPKLARFMSVMHFKYGDYIEGHTQNLVLRLNRKTGKIEGIVAKDMTDVMIDPFIKISKGKAEDVETVRKIGGSLLNIHHIDRATPTIHWAGDNVAGYTGQSVYSFSESVKEVMHFTFRFLEQYIQETEKITGSAVPLSKQSLDILDALKTENVKVLMELALPRRSVDYLFTAIRHVVQNVSDEVTRHRMPKIRPSMLHSDQKKLRSIFHELLKQKQVALLFTDSNTLCSLEIAALYSENSNQKLPKEQRESSESPLSFAYDGRGLIAFEKTTQRVIAYGIVPTMSCLRKAMQNSIPRLTQAGNYF